MQYAEARQRSGELTTAALFRGSYERLVLIARGRLRVMSPPLELSPEGLVHEAFLRLADRSNWVGCEHFVSVAAKTMHAIAVDKVRLRATSRRGGGWRRRFLSAPSSRVASHYNDVDVLEAIDSLSAVSRRAAKVVRLRFFGGLLIREVSQELHVSPATVQNDWRLARNWLFRSLSQNA